MKLNLMMFTIPALLYSFSTSASLHAVQVRIHRRSKINCSATPDDVTEDASVSEPTTSIACRQDENFTSICIATFVGEKTTIVTKLEYLSEIGLLPSEKPTKVLNKSHLISRLVLVCDPDCEQKFNAGPIYVNNNSLDESYPFLDYYANYRCIDEGLPPRATSYEYYLRIVSLFFICFCLLSYIFYLVKFIIDKSLRTLPGSCILSLCIAALSIYPCFFAVKVTPFDVKTRFVCGLYIFTTLANWFWINALTFDLWISIRLATVKLRRIKTRSLILRFIYYSIYAWGIPSVITVVIIHPFPLSERQMYYKSCSLQNKSLAELFIISPFIILQLLNFALFYSSFYMVFKEAKSRSQEEASNLKRNFIFYFKFSCFVAFIWILGIAGYITKTEILIYVLFHAKIMEGPFIVWTFTMTGKAKETCIKFSPLLRISTRESQMTPL